jgi:hypothetical protein
MNNLVEIFCDVDYFSHQFTPKWEAQLLLDGTPKRRRSCKISTNERMNIAIAFNQ